jgi:preprotein translocase subunit SecY
MILMWIGEQIDEYGVGNGISLIIMAGIVARCRMRSFDFPELGSDRRFGRAA